VKRRFTFWTSLGIGIFFTFFIGVLTALAYTSVRQFPAVPWPLALIGFVGLQPLVVLFVKLEMPRTAVLPLVLLVCLIASLVGQAGSIVIGLGLTMSFWVWWTRGFLLEFETVVRLSPAE
jgi:hypothetical protein